MLIREVIDIDRATFQAFADQIKTQYGLHKFDLWLDQHGDIKLNMMVIPQKDRRTGLGTATMNVLCRFADKLGKRIVLSPAAKADNLGTTSKSRLVAFYKRFGFIENKGRKRVFDISDGMYRDPQVA